MRIKGIAHVHSNFSDGLLSLPRIKKKAQSLGADFVLISDHFPPRGDFQKLKRKCQMLSDKNFLFVPGIEVVSKEGYHFLIYNLCGLPSFVAKKNISFQEIYTAFSCQESLLLLAHASLYPRPPSQETLKKLDGIEVWNSKYDSRYAPHLKSLKLTLENNLTPFAGVDAHGPFALKKLWLEMEIKRLEIGELINTLKQGEFKVCSNSLSLNLKEALSQPQILPFKLTNKFYASLRYPFALLVRSRFSCPKVFIKLFQKLYSRDNIWPDIN